MNLQHWHDTGDYFEHNGQQIFYRAEGQGTPLLFIHGYPTASWDWHKIWPSLTKEFRCITLDMLGFGYSDKPNKKYSIFQQADICSDLLEKLRVHDCHVVSHDYGDTVAQELLCRFNEGTLPFQLHSISFLNGGLFPESHKPIFIQKLLLSPLGALIVRLMKRSTFAKNFKNIFAANTPPSEQEIDEFWQLIQHNNGHLVMNRIIHYMVERRLNRERWVGALVQAQIPLRLIDGIKDPISGINMVERYQQVVPNADVVCLENVGHYPQIEAPELVLAAILEHVRQASVSE
ncbi:alpha/beta fold hydrolase [Colwelliaceae bacterium BS250]